MVAPVVDRNHVRKCTVGMVHEFALDPDEAFDCARISDRKVHPAIFLDGMGEVEFHYSAGWKSLFNAEERTAIESYVAFENALPVIEDEIWDDPTISNLQWQELRSAARKLIVALGGLPESLPGRWAK